MSSLKRKLQISKSQRYSEYSDDELIRLRLLYEGDQGNDDRRISTLMKTFNQSSFELEKVFSIVYSIEHSYRLLKSTLQMDEREQLCYAIKSEHLTEQINKLHDELEHSEQRLIKAKQRRLNLLEYDRRTDIINNFNTRKELRTQQITTLERKRYFEHLQQTFEATYQQRLKQIAIYMRPIFELEDILQQDAHEDGLNDNTNEQPATPILSAISKSKLERPRTYSDSSITSIDGDDNTSAIRLKKQSILNHSEMISNEPHPLFSNNIELYGAQLVNPLLFL